MRYALFFIGLASLLAAISQASITPDIKQMAGMALGAGLLVIALAMQARVFWQRRKEAEMPTRRFYWY